MREPSYRHQPLATAAEESKYFPYSAPLYPHAALGNARKAFQKTVENLRRQRWLILAIFLSVLAITIFFTTRQTPRYQAESILLVKTERPLEPSNALTYGYLTSLEDQSMATQVLLLGYSYDLAEQVAQRLLNQKTIPETGQLLSILESDSTISAVAFARQLQNGLVSVEQGAPNALLVRATAPTAPEAAFIANVYVEEAIRRSQDASRQRVSTSRQFLEQRIGESTATLQNAEADLKQYMEQAGAVALDQEVQAAVSNVGRLEASLAEAQIELDMKRASFRSTEEALQRISPALTQRLASGVNRELDQAQQTLAKLQVDLEQIYQRHPELRTDTSDERIVPLRNQIAQWQQRVDQLASQLVSETRATGGSDPSNPESGIAYATTLERQLTNDRITISGLEARVASLQEQLFGYNRRLQHVPQQSVTLAQLERQRTAAEQLNSLLGTKLQEAIIAEESEIGSLRLLQPARAPSAPIYPHPQRNMLLGALLGLLLGMGVALLRSKLDERLYAPEDIQQNGSHLLSVIPNMRSFISKAFGSEERINFEEYSVRTNLVALLAPMSSVAEAYRHLYTRLQLGLPDRVVETIMVTSPEAESGKSTTVINLAITTARANRRTLIIDADMRRPVVHDYLGFTKGPVLQDFLSKQLTDVELDALLVDTFTGFENLHAITVQTPVATPLEMLVSPALRRLIEALRQRFDIIIFDTPPLLLASDATLLAPLFDATVLVTAAGYTHADALQQTEEELAEAGAHVAGVVLNKYDPTTLSNRHTYGYRQRHYAQYYYTQR